MAAGRLDPIGRRHHVHHHEGRALLRPDAVSRPLARSPSVASNIEICYLARAPFSHIHGLLGHIWYPNHGQWLKSSATDPRGIAQQDLQTDRGRHRRGAGGCAGFGACAGEQGSVAIARHRDRAAAARLHKADPAHRGPGEAEHPGRHHQRQRFQRLRRRRPPHLRELRRADEIGHSDQIIGVLAHETGHLAGGHLAKMREQWRRRRPR